MADDPNLPRFMSYLSLFTVCMLFLVTSDNFIQLFFGWEGVGLCSYLLIGFWHKKDSANFAATKAFVANRVGDLGLMLGIITIYINFGSVEFDKIFYFVPNYSNSIFSILGTQINLIETIAFFLFIGCMGKSAQLGLHIWLPDAMEGPTPVSALIHAATMVTAGVFLTARCSYIFEYAPDVRSFIVVIGSLTCIFAALVAMCQTDIKKIIAYSTCSQLGYMFIACGLSSYHAGIFHLYTHAFFKAMLFLAAGSVIHAVHEQDINKMGNLRKYMPVTYALFCLGSLSIMGFFPFSGYYSKDEILVAAYLDESYVGNFAFKMGIMAAFCTAIYSTKIIVKVFHGEGHIKDESMGHHGPHESPAIMNRPLLFLAFGTIFAGMFAYYVLDISTPEYGFFKNSIFFKEFNVGEAPFYIEKLPMFVAIFGIIVGYIFFSTNLSNYLAKTFKPFYTLLLRKFFFDEIYDLVFVKTNDLLANILKVFDKKVIDYLGPTASSYLSLYFSGKMSNVHNGSVSRYAMIFVCGLVLGLTIIVFEFVL
jgi:NADH-quinone oxidoreductase subunit L